MHLRSISTSDKNTDDDKSVDFPYVFLNSDDLVKRPDKVSKDDVDIMTRFLDFDQNEETKN